MSRSIEAQVQDLLDREAIRDLPVRYCHYVWTNDVEGMMGLFTDDGLLSTSSDAGDPEREIAGAPALRAFYVGLDAVKPRPYIHNHVVELLGDGRAKGTCYVELRLATKAMEPLGTGYYDDEYVKQDGVWKFKARRYKAIKGAADLAASKATRGQIAANLKAHERHVIDPTDRRRAAVALLVSPLNGVLTYALTRRALTLRRGAGNYALPGGNFEPGEDAVDAAVRESNEELGLHLERTSAIGLLDDFLTLGGHVVTPVVLWSDTPLALSPDPAEVHAAFLEPLSDLDHPDAPLSVVNPDGGEPILRMYAQGTWINPPTAAFLLQFRDVALHGRDRRVHMVGQPTWTAR